MFEIVIFLVLEHLSTAWIHWTVAACGLWSALRARIKIIIICFIMMTVRVHSAMYVGSRIRWRANWLMNDPDDNASSLCQALADWRLCRDANQKLTVCLAHRQTKLGAPTGHISRAISKMYAVLLFRLRQRVPVWLCETHHMFGSTCVAALLLLLLLFYSASIMDSVLLAGLPHDYLRMVESKNRSSLLWQTIAHCLDVFDGSDIHPNQGMWISCSKHACVRCAACTRMQLSTANGPFQWRSAHIYVYAARVAAATFA